MTSSVGDAGSTVVEEDAPRTQTRARNMLADQVLQSLLLNYGLIEDWEARIIDELGNVDLNESLSGGTTLRHMRSTGNFGQLDGTAQTTLLGGTLYQYSSAAPPTRAADARQAAIQAAAAASSGVAAVGPAAVAAPDANTTHGGTQSEAFVNLRQGLERLIQGSTVGNVSNGSLDDTFMSTGAFSAGPGLDSTLGLLEGNLHDASNVVDDEILASPNQSPDRGLNATMDVLGASQLDEAGRSIRFPASSANSSFDGARTNYNASGIFGEFDHTGILLNLLNNATDFDESLARSVRRVLQMGTVLTEGRAGLTDEEISALPKVRFDQAEEQQCSICLERFQCGELLTALPCVHFFHVSCITRWFEQSTQCPLCRSECVAAS